MGQKWPATNRAPGWPCTPSGMSCRGWGGIFAPSTVSITAWSVGCMLIWLRLTSQSLELKLFGKQVNFQVLCSTSNRCIHRTIHPSVCQSIGWKKFCSSSSRASRSVQWSCLSDFFFCHLGKGFRITSQTQFGLWTRSCWYWYPLLFDTLLFCTIVLLYYDL